MLELALQSKLFQVAQEIPGTGGPEAMAAAFSVPFLGRLPMDPNLLSSCERGLSFLETHPSSAAAASFNAIVQKIVDGTKNNSKSKFSKADEEVDHQMEVQEPTGGNSIKQ